MAKTQERVMELGMIGLGRMGANMTERLVSAGHRVVAFDLNPEAVTRAVESGAERADSLAALVRKLRQPRILWMMVPAGTPVDQTIDVLVEHLNPGDIMLDGGNSHYKDTVRRAASVATRQLHLVDVGTSGGIWGRHEGYSLMIGGDTEVVSRLGPLFETLAPAADRGWARVGPSGSGHFVKMVHNGIEYGLMQAYAEGFSLLEHKKEFGLDLQQIADVWRHGSVVRSWLLDLVARALADDQTLEGIAPYVADSGEGRWTVFESIELDVPAPVIALSLIQRLRSRDERSFADRMLAALRNQFGGHAVKREP